MKTTHYFKRNGQHLLYDSGRKMRRRSKSFLHFNVILEIGVTALEQAVVEFKLYRQSPNQPVRTLDKIGDNLLLLFYTFFWQYTRPFTKINVWDKRYL